MKKVISLSLSVMLLSSFVAHAQKDKNDTTKADNKLAAKLDTLKHWDLGGLLGVTFSQAAFSNWAAGGQNSIGLTSLASFHFNYTDTNFKWLNNIQLGYGFQKNANLPLQKTTDQLEVSSNAGFRVFDHMLVSLLADFQSQFSPGYKFPNDSVLISDFFAPAYLVTGLGLTYYPVKGISVFLSPATARFIFVEDPTLADQGAFGVDPAVYDATGKKIQNGKREKTQVGAYFKGDFSRDILKGVTLTTDLQLFSNYLKDPQNIVVNWTFFLQLKVNKFLSATVNTQLIYDNNVAIPQYKDVNGVNTLTGKGPRTQFKDVIGVGLTYNL